MPTVQLYPSLVALWLDHQRCRLRRKPVESVGRLWLLLRYLAARDKTGGWVDCAVAERELTTNGPLRLYSQRCLRMILQRGEGVFWTKGKDSRLYLKGPAKVAAALGLDSFRGRTVEIPVSRLVGTIAAVRALFYEAWHVGRIADGPIARSTLVKVTGCSKRRQRKYEQRRRIKRGYNVAIYADYSDRNLDNARYRHGKAAYVRGGRVCFRIANSYASTDSGLRPIKSQRQRKLNKELHRLRADPRNYPAQGNDAPYQRWYWQTDGEAYQAWDREQRETYGRERGGSGPCLWQAHLPSLLPHNFTGP